MVHETVTLEGHLIDSDIMRRVFDRVVEGGGEFEVLEFRVGRTNDEASFALARTVERFKVPRDVIVVCLGKSTYARCGIIVNVTPLEPEWEGIVTLEVSNTTPLPARIYAGEGIAQMLFFQSDEPCEVSYADKKGKYQSQKGLTLPRL